MKKRVILFANGTVTKREISIVAENQFDLIVAADGGLSNAEHFGFIPDAVVGDFDSLPAGSQRHFPETRFVHRPSQNRCDLEKALIFCGENRCTDITVLGATGKRLDHTLGNLSLLTRYDARFHLRVLTPDAEVFIVRDKLKLTGKPGQSISLISLGEAQSVMTTGLKYPLSGDPLIFGQREGTSNEFSAGECTVSIRGGLLFVFRAYPEG